MSFIKGLFDKVLTSLPPLLEKRKTPNKETKTKIAYAKMIGLWGALIFLPIKTSPNLFPQIRYNPNVPKSIAIDLCHTEDHSSVVCCVRFSNDGQYFATGCNRSAQIFDVETGAKVK
jgi:WD40 repeat protein